jgi:type II secretory pathway pseudopilin PulG
MTWGSDIAQWLASDEGWRVLSGAIIPAVAIVVAGIVAALIGRGSTKRVIAVHERDALAAALSAFLLAGRRAATWNTLSDTERAHLDHLAAEAETRIRLLPLAGANLAASWAGHELTAMKRDSAGFQFQAQQTLADYRDHLVMWSKKPRTAKKLFGTDLERWQFEVAEPAADERNAPGTASGPAGVAPAAVVGAVVVPAADVVPVIAAEVQSAWVPASSATERSPLTPEPPTAVATASGTMPLIVTPVPAATVRERVRPDSASETT